GKEVVARLIHNLSKRNKKPFIAVNCAAIPETLLESELFGYKKGAFTGAYETKKGLLSAANEGTIFLDEICDLPLSLQAKLLRAIESGSFIPIGSTKEEKVDLRIISATNKDLKKLIEEGKFREDLYYRLSVFPIYIPPLRERKEDIEILVKHFLKIYSKKMGKNFEIKEDALSILKNYSWPGNVRELENLMERLAILSEDGIIDATLIPEEIKTEANSFDLKRMEYNFLKKIIKECDGDIKKAAKKLGIHPSTLYRKIKKFKEDEQV
ncbi:MAG: sigma-54 dependent transcriptional regulator, partial [candidate division WOR-3 bacterium]